MLFRRLKEYRITRNVEKTEHNTAIKRKAASVKLKLDKMGPITIEATEVPTKTPRTEKVLEACFF